MHLITFVTQGSSYRGQRSNFKNHQHAWIELKFSSNDPCDTLNMRKMHLITFVTQGSSYRGQRSNFKNNRHAWIELKFSSNDPCDTLNMRKMHLITSVTQGSSYKVKGQISKMIDMHGLSSNSVVMILVTP